MVHRPAESLENVLDALKFKFIVYARVFDIFLHVPTCVSCSTLIPDAGWHFANKLFELFRCAFERELFCVQYIHTYTRILQN